MRSDKTGAACDQYSQRLCSLIRIATKRHEESQPSDGKQLSCLCFFVAQLAVKSLDVFNQSFLRVVHLDKLETARAELLAQGFVVNQPAQSGGKRFNIAGRHTDAAVINL